MGPEGIRVATFNLENLDDQANQKPSLVERARLMRPQLVRLQADILCLQEVNGQKVDGQGYALRALDTLLAGTAYAGYHHVATHGPTESSVFAERNLVILSRFPILEHRQVLNDLARAPRYLMVTAQPPQPEADAVTWERPLLHARIQLGEQRLLDVINVHLKSRLPTAVPGQKASAYAWKTAAGWAEGVFLSSMKRVGQALEARMFIDQLLDAEADRLMVVCGDFNAEADEVAVEAMCGDIENTLNPKLTGRVLVPCERTVPEPGRYSLLHRGRGRMLDHVLVSRNLLQYYRGVEIHNELLHDESVADATDVRYPESDHAPVVAEFMLSDLDRPS